MSTNERLTVDPVAEGFACSECRRVFASLAGCRLHQRSAHANTFHAQEAAAAEASAARAWTPDEDANLWAGFMQLAHLPAPERYSRLVADSSRTLSAIQQRLKALRKNPPNIEDGAGIRPTGIRTVAEVLPPSNPRSVWTRTRRRACGPSSTGWTFRASGALRRGPA